MDSKELLAYRIQILDDAIRMKKKPDRTPHISNYGWWQFMDAGYKMSEAVGNYDIIEDCFIKFFEKYTFDISNGIGILSTIPIVQKMGRSYKIDDEQGGYSVEDITCMNQDEYDALLENYWKFLWEVMLPRKYDRFNSNLSISELEEVFNLTNRMQVAIGRLTSQMSDKLGMPKPVTYNMMLSFETLFQFYRGIKGLSSDLRKCPDKVQAACEMMDAMTINPMIENMKNMPDSDAIDVGVPLLAHTILNPKQWERFYWPKLKEIIDAVVAADKTIYLFAEGSTKRFWSYFKDIPAGHVAMHVEQDDVFELRQALPNICIVGGMPTSLLGRGTPDECVAHTKRLIDELGANGGFILSQDKMVSYRNDTKPENLKAVCDFVNNYR